MKFKAIAISIVSSIIVLGSCGDDNGVTLEDEPAEGVDALSFCGSGIRTQSECEDRDCVWYGGVCLNRTCYGGKPSCRRDEVCTGSYPGRCEKDCRGHGCSYGEYCNGWTRLCEKDCRVHGCSFGEYCDERTRSCQSGGTCKGGGVCLHLSNYGLCMSYQSLGCYWQR